MHINIESLIRILEFFHFAKQVTKDKSFSFLVAAIYAATHYPLFIHKDYYGKEKPPPCPRWYHVLVLAILQLVEHEKWGHLQLPSLHALLHYFDTTQCSKLYIIIICN